MTFKKKIFGTKTEYQSLNCTNMTSLIICFLVEMLGEKPMIEMTYELKLNINLVNKPKAIQAFDKLEFIPCQSKHIQLLEKT